MPPKQTKNHQKNLDDCLGNLFESDDEEEEFFGFDIELTTLFESDDEEDEFFGFDINLTTLFEAEDEEDEFLGFATQNDTANLALIS